MGQVGTNQFKKRLRVIVDDQPWVFVDVEFVKPGKGQAFTKVKMKNLLHGRVIERTYKSGTSVEEADVSFAKMQFLYANGDDYTFMDVKNYEQIEVPKDALDGAEKWLLDGTECEVSMWNDKPISIEPPNFMVFEITYTEPAVKGNTSTNVMKAATIETGAEIQVPLFIDTGMKVKVDTRDGSYVERAKE